MRSCHSDVEPIERRQAIDRALSRRLREERVRARLSQKALAKILGVSYQQVQKYESGSAHIPVDKIILFANYIECSLKELFHRDEVDPHTRQLSADTGNFLHRFEILAPHEKELVACTLFGLAGAPSADGRDPAFASDETG